MFCPMGATGLFYTLKRCAWTVRVFWSPGEPILRTVFFEIVENLKKHVFQILVMFSSSKFDFIAILPNLRSSYDDPF